MIYKDIFLSCITLTSFPVTNFLFLSLISILNKTNYKFFILSYFLFLFINNMLESFFTSYRNYSIKKKMKIKKILLYVCLKKIIYTSLILIILSIFFLIIIKFYDQGLYDNLFYLPFFLISTPPTVGFVVILQYRQFSRSIEKSCIASLLSNSFIILSLYILIRAGISDFLFVIFCFILGRVILLILSINGILSTVKGFFSFQIKLPFKLINLGFTSLSNHFINSIILYIISTILSLYNLDQMICFQLYLTTLAITNIFVDSLSLICSTHFKNLKSINLFYNKWLFFLMFIISLLFLLYYIFINGNWMIISESFKNISLDTIGYFYILLIMETFYLFCNNYSIYEGKLTSVLKIRFIAELIMLIFMISYHLYYECLCLKSILHIYTSFLFIICILSFYKTFKIFKMVVRISQTPSS